MPRPLSPNSDIFSLPPAQLRFDTENPRLATSDAPIGETDAAIARYLYDHEELSELLQSIAENGYLNMEPLIVTRLPGHDGSRRYTVLEGNRRLAAVRVLTNKALQAECKIDCPAMAAELRPTLNEILVLEVPDRFSANAYIGFKHVNGPQRWDSLAKARFAVLWLKQEDTSLDHIARRLGDNHSTVRRLVQGYYVLQQAESWNVFHRDDVYGARSGKKFAFSHLYTALTKSGYRDYLGMPEDWRSGELPPQLVPENKREALGRVMGWLYGSRSNHRQSIIASQNPDLARLDAVLCKAEPRLILERTGDLDRAYDTVIPALNRFQESLVDAKFHTEQALSQAHAFNGGDESLLEIAEALRRAAVKLAKAMRARVDGEDMDGS